MKVNNGLEVIFQEDAYYVSMLGDDPDIFAVGYFDYNHYPLNDRYFIYSYADDYLVCDDYLPENWYLRRYNTLLDAFRFVILLLKEDEKLSTDPWYINCKYGKFDVDSACYNCHYDYCQENRDEFCPFI